MVLENKQGLHMTLKKNELQRKIIDFLPTAKNMTRKQIAKALNISVITLRAHLNEINSDYVFCKDTGAVIHKEDRRQG